MKNLFLTLALTNLLLISLAGPSAAASVTYPRTARDAVIIDVKRLLKADEERAQKAKAKWKAEVFSTSLWISKSYGKFP